MPIVIMIIVLLSVLSPVISSGENLNVSGISPVEVSVLRQLDSVFAHDASSVALSRDLLYDSQMHDATMTVMDIRMRWNEFSPEFREIASGYFLSKTVNTTYQLPSRMLAKGVNMVRATHLLPNWIETEHFNIEWGNNLINSDRGTDSGHVTACSSAYNNGTGCSGIPDSVDKWADYLEEVWAFETVQLGYIRPTGTDTYLYDVYIANTKDNISGNSDDLTPALAGTYLGLTVTYCDKNYFQICKDENTQESYSYIVVNNSYTDEQTMKITAAHEFFHAIQFAYPSIDEWWYFPDNHWWIEATATWMEEVVYDESNHYYPRVWSWLRSPQLSLKNSGTSYSGHEYGDVIFILYMTDVYLKNREFVRDVWENGKSGTESLNTVLATDKYGRGDFESAFRGFVALNAVADIGEPSGGYEEGESYGRAAAVRAVGIYPVASSVSPLSAPHELGSNYIQFLPQDKENNTLTVEFDGADGINWGTMLVKVRGDGTGFERNDMAIDLSSGSSCLSVDGFGSDYSEVFLVASVLIEPGLMETAPYGYKASLGSKCPDTGSSQAFSVARISEDSPETAGSSDKRCFIATVAFGSSDSPYVLILREFRDRYLMTSMYGRLFVAAYYTVSPSIADFLENHHPAPMIVRYALFPFIGIVYLILHTSIFALTLSVVILLSILSRIKHVSR
ncbi:MAG: hypothetical protein IT393_11500 [Nitrospirae bacterium]|nr:hypothetical protein [Nitrospirota bacterium]